MRPFAAALPAAALGLASLGGCSTSVGQAISRALAPDVTKAPGFDTMQVRRMAVAVETGFEHDALRAPLLDAVTNALMRRGYTVVDRRSSAPVDVFADLTISVGQPGPSAPLREGSVALRLTRTTTGEVIWTAQGRSQVDPAHYVNQFTSGAELLVRQLPALPSGAR